MSRRNIFLSYRRNDIPGYVRILEEQLEQEFGDGRVFRDTSDIPGGADWRKTIEDNLRESAVLLLIIGKHWERLWRERADEAENYVAYELQMARDFGVEVIPVTVDGVEISRDCDLGAIGWIRDGQHHDLSDKQRRWSNDFRELVGLLEKIPGIGTAKSTLERRDEPGPKETPSRLKWLGAGAGIALLAVAWLAYDYGPGYDDGPFPALAFPPENQAAGSVDAAYGLDAPWPEPVAADDTPAGTVDISGVWQGQDGTIYQLAQYPDGTIEMQSPGYTYGYGTRLDDTPASYEIELAGVGYGQFSVSADGRTIDGWLDVDGERIFDRLVRVQ